MDSRMRRTPPGVTQLDMMGGCLNAARAWVRVAPAEGWHRVQTNHRRTQTRSRVQFDLRGTEEEFELEGFPLSTYLIYRLSSSEASGAGPRLRGTRTPPPRWAGARFCRSPSRPGPALQS
jgi:hypothetical protein